MSTASSQVDVPDDMSTTSSIESGRQSQKPAQTVQLVSEEDISQLALKAKLICNDLANAADLQLTEDHLKSFEVVRRYLNRIIKCDKKREKDLRLTQHAWAKQKERAATYSEQINQCFASIPTQEAIYAATKLALQNHMRELTGISTTESAEQAAENLVPPSSAPPTTQEDPQPPQRHQEQQDTPESQQQDHIFSNPNQNILVIRAKNGATGNDILKFISRQNISCPATDKIAPRQSSLEIHCCSLEAKRQLQRDLQKNRLLNRELLFQSKPSDLYKMILIGVPGSSNLTDIHQNIRKRYILHEGELSSLRTTSSRQNGKRDWLLLMPKALAKAILQDGGLVVGITLCRLRPFTSIRRCRHCQLFGHTEKRCRSSPQCENCGGQHSNDNCQEPTNCINCTAYNRLNNSNFSTCHKSSASACEVYRTLYSNQRKHVDDIFAPATPDPIQDPPPRDLGHQHVQQDRQPPPPRQDPPHLPEHPRFAQPQLGSQNHHPAGSPPRQYFPPPPMGTRFFPPPWTYLNELPVQLPHYRNWN